MHTNISLTPFCNLERPSFPKKSGRRKKKNREVHTLTPAPMSPHVKRVNLNVENIHKTEQSKTWDTKNTDPSIHPASQHWRTDQTL